MNRRVFLKALAVLGVAGKAFAGQDIILNPGDTLNLEQDLVLTGATNLVIQGTPDQPCTVEGNNYSIRSGDGWTGGISAQNCFFRNLGTPSAVDDNDNLIPGAPAIAVTATGSAMIFFGACDFDGCNQVLVTTNDTSAAAFMGNQFRTNGTFWVDKSPYPTQNSLILSGSSAARKFFQGNYVLRSGPSFQSGYWKIGGHDAEGNVISGLRATLESGTLTNVAHGNYIRVDLTVDPDMYPYWSQIVTVVGAFRRFEGNVINAGRYLLREITGEFARNLLVNVHGANFVQIGNASIHHNIFAHVDEQHDRIGDNYFPIADSFVEQRDGLDSFEVYNNTFDGSGFDADHPAAIHGITLDYGSFMPTANNNIFYNVPGDWVIGPKDPNEAHEPYPERLGFGDYNLFWGCPGVPYAVGVPGLNYGDDGYGGNDVFEDPQFQGPVPIRWPYDEGDIIAGTVTVKDILHYYRSVYRPGPKSPIRGAGIGAV